MKIPGHLEKISVLIPCLKETELLTKNKQILSNSSIVDEFITEIGASPVGKARQTLLLKAKNELVFWLDDDVELFENPLDKLHEYISKNTKIAGISCFIFEEDKKYNYFEIERQLLPKIYPKRQGHFMCGLFRKSLLLEAGGFDTTLDVAEDHDMQIKLKNKGYEIMCFRDLIVKHHIKRDFNKNNKYFEGRKYLFNKYGFFEDEQDSINFYSSKARIKMFNISKKYIIDKLIGNIHRKLVFALSLINGLAVNLVKEYLPEWFKPQVCGILITENCIFKCDSCLYWRSHKKDLSLDKIIEIIDKLNKFKIPKIILVGGEPLLRDDFGNIVDYIRKCGIKVGVVTNGYYGEKRLEDLLKLDEIIVSVDGMKETHNRLRGVDSWDKALDLIYLLKNKYNKDVKLAFVFQKDNYKDLKVIASFMKKTEVPVEILCYSTRGMGQPEESDKMNYKKELEEVICEIDNKLINEEQLSYFKLVKEKLSKMVSKQECIVANFKIMIDANGGVYPCSAWEKPVANIFENDEFDKIWKSYSNLRKEIRTGNCEGCIRCRSCELTVNYVVGTNYIKRFITRMAKKVKLKLKN